MSQECSPDPMEAQLQEMDTIAAGSRAVLKVEDNNEKMLDELFNLKSNSHLNSKPLKERGLPSSFWKTHSSSKQLCRQLLSSNSQHPFSFDKVSPNMTPFPQTSTGTTPFPGAPTGSQLHYKHHNFPAVNHTRSRSSPATCYSQTSLRQHAPTDLGVQEFQIPQPQQQPQQQRSQPQQQPRQQQPLLHHQHQQQQQQQQQQLGNWNPDQQLGLMDHIAAKRQQSGFQFNVSEFPTNSSIQGDLDFGGFSHPQLQPQHMGTSFPPPRHSRAHSNVDNLSLPLPKGWERGLTPDREVFYIDHNSRSTSWTHPGLLPNPSFFPQQAIGSPQHRPSCFQPGELSTIREIAQQQQLLSRMNINDEPFYSHSHQGSQDSGIGIIGADHTVETIQPGEDFLLSKLDNSHVVAQMLSHDPIPFPGSNNTITDDPYLVDTSEDSEFQLQFQSTSPTHYDVSKLQASISTEMLLDAVTAVDPITPQSQP